MRCSGVGAAEPGTCLHKFHSDSSRTSNMQMSSPFKAQIHAPSCLRSPPTSGEKVRARVRGDAGAVKTRMERRRGKEGGRRSRRGSEISYPIRLFPEERAKPSPAPSLPLVRWLIIAFFTSLSVFEARASVFIPAFSSARARLFALFLLLLSNFSTRRSLS